MSINILFLRLSAIINRWTAQCSSSSRQTRTINCEGRAPDCIVETFLHHFRGQAANTPHWPTVYFDNDVGVGDGVTREAFALFWDAVRGRMFQTQGGDLSIPTLSPAYNSQLWEVIGRILAYTVAVLGQFPLVCICQVVCRTLLGLEGDEDEDVLVADFLSTLSERERDLLSPLLSYQEEELREFVASRREDLLAILREFNVSSLPATCQMRSLLVNVSRFSLLEAPRAALTAMQVGFQSVSGRAFSGITGQAISHWYEQQRRPIYEQIVERLELDSDEDGAGRVFNLLLTFLTEHRDDEDLLRDFLRYTTGSPNARGGSIRVDVSRAHRVITHQTCFMTIRLPVIPDEREAEEAFLVQLLAELRNNERWTFNSG